MSFYNDFERNDTVRLVATVAVTAVILLLSACSIRPEVNLTESKVCPTLAMPAIPDRVYLDITGNQIQHDEGGIKILRYYVKARSLLK